MLDGISKKFNTEISDRVYIDEGKSAYSGKNLQCELGVLLEDIRSKKIKPRDIIVMRHLDRLSRLPLMDALSVYSDIINHGVNIYTPAGDCLFTSMKGGSTRQEESMSMMVAQFSFQLANEESYKKSYLTNVASMKRIKQLINGEKSKEGFSYDVGVGSVPFAIAIENKCVVPHPVNFKIVQDLIKYALKGNGIMKCVDWLFNRHGIERTKQGISKLLASESLYGKLIINIQDRDAMEKYREEHFEDEYITRKYEFDDYYPEVCTEDEYHQLQALRKRGKKSKGNRKKYTLLSGRRILHCGDCGNSLAANHTYGKGATYYTCINRKCSVSEKIYVLNNIVLNATMSFINTPYIQEENQSTGQQAYDLKMKIEGYRIKSKKLTALFFEEDELLGDMDEYKNGLLKVKLKIQSLEQELLALESQNVSSPVKKELKLWCCENSAFRNLIFSNDSDVNQKHGDILAKYIKNITVKSDGLIEIHTVDGREAYYYLPLQNKNTGRRVGVNLNVDDVLAVDNKVGSDNIFKHIIFTKDEIKNGKYVNKLDEIHPSLISCYSEPHTEKQAFDNFIDALKAASDIEPLVVRKRDVMFRTNITDKQWNTHKKRAIEYMVRHNLFNIKKNAGEYLIRQRKAIPKDIVEEAIKIKEMDLESDSAWDELLS